MLIVIDDLSCNIPVPTDVAVCPDCQGNLTAFPNELEECGPDPDTHKVFTPIIDCQNDANHGVDMTDDWFETYDAVATWFATITVKHPFVILE